MMIAKMSKLDILHIFLVAMTFLGRLRHGLRYRRSQAEPSLVPGQLKPIQLPGILHEDLLDFNKNGWSKVPLIDNMATGDLGASFEALFSVSRAFFDQSISRKEQFLTKAGSEEGWSRIEGEKEMITLRTLDGTPEELRDAASQAWGSAALLLNGMIGGISQSLGLPDDTLSAYSSPNLHMDGVKRSTMLRLFRYEGDQPKIVAEGESWLDGNSWVILTLSSAHKDLGLLSLVLGDTPGLEAWDVQGKTWLPIEKTFTSPTATVMVGRELEYLSNGIYQAGGHRVLAYGTDSPRSPPSKSEEGYTPPAGPPPGWTSTTPKYRFSIVFVMRAHWPVPIDLDTLTTPITGPFQPLNLTKNQQTVSRRTFTAGDLFFKVKGSHFNINTNIKERDKQKRDLATKARRMSEEQPRS